MNIMNVMNVSRGVPGKWPFIVSTVMLWKTFITFITFSPYKAMRLRDREKPLNTTLKDNSEVRKLFEDLLPDWIETTASNAATRTIEEAWPMKMKDPGR
jgi:hypothetical protein